MSFTAIISGIFAIAEAIPAARDLFDKVTAAWVALRVAKWEKEKREAYRKLLDEQDQRDLEEAIGNPNAGKPSNDEGAVVRPDRPGGQ